MNTPIVRRGDVWLVALDPTVGAEISKTRPSVVISNDVANQYALTVTILPITNKGEKVRPYEAAIPAQVAGLIKDSKAKCQQVRTVDKQRLIRYLGNLPDQYIHDIERAVCLHLGISGLEKDD